MATSRTVAQEIAAGCHRHCVRRVFGVPGGGSCLDLLAAFDSSGIEFVLARTETGAAFMAAATAEAGGGIGVVLTTQGPGSASAVNGIAHASLDRAPVLLISDGWTSAQTAFDTHQVIDQSALLAPLVKGTSRLESESVAAELETLIALAKTEPWGAVYLEITGENARRVVTTSPAPNEAGSSATAADPAQVDAARALLESARRPVILLGLEARSEGVGAQVLALARRLNCPVLPTYKAKGIVSDDEIHVVGHFTGGAVERECVDSADLVVFCGLDPVELIGRPWPYSAPVLDLGPIRHAVHYTAAKVAVYQPLSRTLEALSSVSSASRWTASEMRRMRERFARRLSYAGTGTGVAPDVIVREAQDHRSRQWKRVTVDAGAHMFSAMAFWKARRHGDVLISNGLASMGFALPAAIALSLNSGDPVLCFSGDGGLLMCLGELATAVQCNARVCVVVFNDATLSLIDIKQRARGLPRLGVSGPRVDFAAAARGLGVEALTADTVDSYRRALDRAASIAGPCLIDVAVDPTGYLQQSIALRG